MSYVSKNRQQFGVEDMVLLSKVTEDQITENLKKRIMADLMFTYIGPTLVAVNPFKKMPYFTQKEIDIYNGSAAYEHPPHIYAVADRMFHNMLVDEENQCVIISGESGAGKTESAKLVMSYISEVSSKGGCDTANIVETVKNIIMESNPLLEAFGNAKTLRNNNSSRFGKYFEINFSKSGAPMGGKISNFLLEKSRVAGPKVGERNFHIFYQLTKGAPASMRENLGLAAPERFNYLNMSREYDADGVNDVQEFADTCNAMEICQISQEEQEAIFRISCAVLHLGNIEFIESEDGHSTLVSDPNALEYPSFLLGVTKEFLGQKLISRVMTTGVGKRGSTYEVRLNTEQAKGTRDALARALYSRLFDWIVTAVNSAMHKLASTLRESQILSLGVLDIFGFEIFDKNGFEQFCINYVNEKLQQIFIELTLKTEQEEYAQEGIKWTPVDFFNNKIVVDLIESRKLPGVMAILDDVCSTMHAVNEGADSTFLQKLNSAVKTHKHFVGMQEQFVIKHYAGNVTYDVEGFTEANKDTLFKDLIQLVQSSNDQFLKNLFPDSVDESDKKRPTTVSFKIKSQSQDLVSTLIRCTPSYVRCIKPNETKRAKDWDAGRVDHQVRYLNLQESIKVRRAGFCYRNYFDKFMKRYGIICAETFPKWNKPVKEGIAKIMAAGNLESSDWQLGVNKVFIKAPESLFLLEEARDRKYHHYAKIIQRNYRTWKSQKYFIEMREKAADVMFNKKERKRFSINRSFIGDYLCVVDNPVLKALIGSKTERTVFSSEIIKYDRKFKPSFKELLVTNSNVFFIGTEKIKSGIKKGQYEKVVKRKIPFNQIKSISLSTLADDILVFQIDKDFDNVIETVFKTELVTVISENYEIITGQKLKILFSDLYFLLTRISYEVKKTTWQSGGVHTLRFLLQTQGALVTSKNSGKETVIFVPGGLPKSTRPQKKILKHTHKGKMNNSNASQLRSPTGFVPTLQGHRISAAIANQRVRAPEGMNMTPVVSIENLNISMQKSAATSGSVTLFNSQDLTAAAKKKKPPPPPPKKLPQAKALYVYEASEADELSLKVGDIIVIKSKEDEGWWIGSCNGKTGLFPSNYVEML